MPINIRIDGLQEFRSDVGRAGNEVPNHVRWAMVQSVNVVKNSAQHLAPFKTGNLRRSIFTDIQDNGFRGVVGSDPSIASYAAGIEYGTKAHDIVPVNKQALFWKGALNPYKRVRHPGTRAQPFMEPAIEDNVNRIKDYFMEAMDRIVKIMAGK